MRRHRYSIRPSRSMSILSAVVVLGLIACVIGFFVHPILAIIGFVGVWLLTAIGILVYHLSNAFSRDGVDVAHVDVHHHDRDTRPT